MNATPDPRADRTCLGQDGSSERLLAPTNLLVVGNVIHTISTAPVTGQPCRGESHRFVDWKRFRA